MECATCKHWVHAKCEGLSNEKYEVLSTLPEVVEYVCKYDIYIQIIIFHFSL